jgi:bacterial leucyl aminopeptidase
MRKFVLLMLVAMLLTGCNLATDDGPATLQPRAQITDAPLPTLGYSTLAPQAGGTPVSTPISQVSNAQLYTLLNQVTANSLYSTIQTLQSFHTRHVNSWQNDPTRGVGAAANWLNGEFLKIQDASRGNFQAFTHPFRAFHDGQETTQHNIVGVINGTLPETPAIVIGAHYDSRTDNLEDSTSFAPGADDNGSGVAAVLEIARIMSQIRPRSTMIFVLFAAEEVNRQGSRAFVRDYVQFYNIPVRVMINVDTVGSVDDPSGNVNDRELRIFSEGPDESRSRDMARMIDFMIENYSTDLKLVFVEDIDREGRFGDHFSFNEVGIPAVRIIEALEDTPRREGRDLIEFVEPEYLRKSTRTLATMMLALSDGMPHPTEIIVRDMGNGEGRLIWQPVAGATGYIVALRRPGESTFEQQFASPADMTAYDCTCFARFSGIAVGALNEDGIIGPLSPEVKPPQTQ